MLARQSDRLSEPQKERMYKDIYDDATWLINLVENLLSVTRFDDGTMEIALQPAVVSDVVHEALLHVNRHADNHDIGTDVADAVLVAKMDARLIMQVLINLVTMRLPTPLRVPILLFQLSRKRWAAVNIFAFRCLMMDRVFLLLISRISLICSTTEQMG